MNADPQRKPALPNGPASARGGSTTAQLKADITTGKDKGRVMDSEHGLSQLGTDDEAGGTPNSPELIDQMRALETPSDARNAAAPGRHDAAPKSSRVGLYLALAVVVAVAVVWFTLTRSSGGT